MKLDVRALCTEQTEAATRIGAVNTLTPIPGGGLRGDNTDWLGIRDCARRAGAVSPQVGVCVGAGGSARAAMWALRGLGVESLYIWNRTHEKAEQLAGEFGGTAVRDLSTLSGRADVVVSNVPGEAQGDVPAQLSPSLGPGTVVIDMAYKPRVTPLLRAAADRGAGTVEGFDVLVEQGLYQFRQWTGQNPPRKAIRAAVDARLAEEAAG